MAELAPDAVVLKEATTRLANLHFDLPRQERYPDPYVWFPVEMYSFGIESSKEGRAISQTHWIIVSENLLVVRGISGRYAELFNVWTATDAKALLDLLNPGSKKLRGHDTQALVKRVRPVYVAKPASGVLGRTLAMASGRRPAYL